VWKNTPPALTGTGGFESVVLYRAQSLLSTPCPTKSPLGMSQLPWESRKLSASQLAAPNTQPSL